MQNNYTLPPDPHLPLLLGCYSGLTWKVKCINYGTNISENQAIYWKVLFFDKHLISFKSQIFNKPGFETLKAALYMSVTLKGGTFLPTFPFSILKWNQKIFQVEVLLFNVKHLCSKGIDLWMRVSSDHLTPTCSLCFLINYNWKCLINTHILLWLQLCGSNLDSFLFANFEHTSCGFFERKKMFHQIETMLSLRNTSHEFF